MAWTEHGHLVSGTLLDYDDRPKQIARCGGPGFCDACSKEAATIKQEYYKKVAEAQEALAQQEFEEQAANEAAVEAIHGSE